jgi:hypothetical protein
VTGLLQHLVDLLRYAVQIVPGNFCQLMTSEEKTTER